MPERPQIWLDGRLVAHSEAQVSVLAHSLHYGSAVFDGCRFYRCGGGERAIFRLRDHVRRFIRSARALFVPVPLGEEELCAASVAVVRASGLAEGYVRQLAFLGDEAPGLGARNPVHVAVAVWSPSSRSGAPIAVRIAGFGHGAGWVPAAKHAGYYGRGFLALREAQASGCDDALFLGEDGTLAEATGANVFAVIGDVLVTPPEAAPLLAGVTRATLLTLAREAGIQAREAPLARHQALVADELFLANSAAELRPVARLEGREYAAPGPVCRALSERYAAVVRGQDAGHLDWLTVVEGGP